MKQFMKYAAICLVVATVSGGYLIWRAPLPAEPQAPVDPIVEPVIKPVTEQDFSWIKIDEDTPSDDEVPMLKEPSITVNDKVDGTVVIDREWGSKPDDADTKPAPDVPDANIASGGGDMDVDEDGVYRGDVEPTPPVEQPKPQPPVEPQPIPEPVKPEPTPEPPVQPDIPVEPEPTPEPPVEPDVDSNNGKPNYEGEYGDREGDWIWWIDDWIIPLPDNGGTGGNHYDPNAELSGEKVGTM